MLNPTVQASVQTECLNQSNSYKQARQSRKDQPWRRLATKNKIAQVKGWNLPTYREQMNIETLLKHYGEYSYLTGKHLGNYYLSTLDLDIHRAEFHPKLVNRLVKNIARLLDYLKVSYTLTKRGFHIDILTPQPLNNGTIYRIDKLGKKWNLGSIQSQGRYVVGEDQDKKDIANRKWYWKVKSNEEVKTTLAKFFFEFKEAEQSEQKTPLETIQEPQPSLSLNLNPSTINIQAKILSKQKIPLPDLWKFFYSVSSNFSSLSDINCQGYFLANSYTQNLTDLRIGAVKNIRIIQGRKHLFFLNILNA